MYTREERILTYTANTGEMFYVTDYEGPECTSYELRSVNDIREVEPLHFDTELEAQLGRIAVQNSKLFDLAVEIDAGKEAVKRNLKISTWTQSIT